MQLQSCLVRLSRYQLPPVAIAVQLQSAKSSRDVRSECQASRS